MSNLLNITPYVFLERFGSVTSFPNDYTKTIFQRALSYLPDSKYIPNCALVVHREREAIYYMFISRIGIYSQDELFGLCVVTTNLMFSKLGHVFKLFGRVYRYCYKNKLGIGEHPCGLMIMDYAYTDNQLSFNKVQGEKIRSILVDEFENYPYINKIPPVILSEEADTERTYFGFDNSNILSDSYKPGYVVIRMPVIYVSYVEKMMPKWEKEFKKCNDEPKMRAYLEKYGKEEFNPYVINARNALFKPDPKPKSTAIVGKVLTWIGILAVVGFLVYCVRQVIVHKTNNLIIMIAGLVGILAYIKFMIKNDS